MIKIASGNKNRIMKMRKLVISGLLIFSCIGTYSQEIRKTNEEQPLNTLSSKISWESIGLTSAFLKPETTPATSDQTLWKLISQTSVPQKLGGVSGILGTQSFSASTGRVDCQTWTSGNHDL